MLFWVALSPKLQNETGVTWGFGPASLSMAYAESRTSLLSIACIMRLRPFEKDSGLSLDSKQIPYLLKGLEECGEVCTAAGYIYPGPSKTS